MKSLIKFIPTLIIAIIILFLVQPASASMNPEYTGYVRSQTGAPIIGATVRQTSYSHPQRCLTDENGNPTSCSYDPPAERANRYTTTDQNGYFYFGTSGEFNCISNPQTFRVTISNGSCDAVDDEPNNFSTRRDINITCNVTPPPTPTPPPACNVACSSGDYCLQAPDGCTSCIGGTCQKCEAKPAETRTVACPPGHTGSITETRTYACPAGTWSNWTATSNSCTPPPACGDSCTSDSYCFGASDGCTSCVPNDAGTGSVCARPPVCGSSCVRDSQCIGDAARDGCTACVSGTCRTPPACGTACTTKADCTGARDSCTECLEGTCTDYSDKMCKCDGINAELNYPNDFKFEAFGMVKGSDAKKAEIADITFRLTKDNAVVAKSNPITPTIVQNDSTKIRFKADWTTPPPQVSRDSTYRVFADVRCKPKRIVASGGELASIEQKAPVEVQAQTTPKSFQPKGLVWLIKTISNTFNNGNISPFVSEALAQLSSPSPSSTAGSNLQLSTLNFVKLMDTNNCNFVMFKFDETLF